MVDIKHFEITRDGSSLHLKASVSNLIWFKNTKIVDVFLKSQDTSKGSENIFHSDIGSKDVDITILDSELKSLQLKTDLIIVEILIDTVAPDTPCGLDSIKTVGYTFWKCPLFNNMMNYVNSIDKDCIIPKDFINLFLLYKAYQLSVLTKNEHKIIEYYKLLSDKRTIISNPCSCNE